MSKFTKGPWSVKDVYNPGLQKGSYLWIVNAEKKHIATLADQGFGSGKEDEANADLLAAAPEMLEALQEIVETCLHPNRSITGLDVIVYQEIIAKALLND